MATNDKSLAAALCLEATPSAMLGASVGMAFAASPLAAAGPLAAAAVAGATALGCWQVLQRLVRRAEVLPLPSFEPAPFECAPAAFLDELLLDEPSLSGEMADELLLDDPLAAAEPDSRVVHLFDPARMPTAGELRSRIERHLRGGTPGAAAVDATEELHQALMELRRSLG